MSNRTRSGLKQICSYTCERSPKKLRLSLEGVDLKEQWGIDNPNLRPEDDSYHGDTMVIVNSSLRDLEPVETSTPRAGSSSNSHPDHELFDRLITLTKARTHWRSEAPDPLTESSASSPSDPDSPPDYTSPAEQNPEDDQLASLTAEADTSLTGYVTPPNSVSTASFGFSDAIGTQDPPTSLLMTTTTLIETSNSL